MGIRCHHYWVSLCGEVAISTKLVQRALASLKIVLCPYRPVGQAALLGQNDLGLCESIGGVKRESFPEQHANSTGSKSDTSGIFYESLLPPLVSEERCNRNYSFREAGALEKGKVGMGAPGAEL